MRIVADHLKTALHWAAEMDHAEVAAALVEAGADIEARTTWGASSFDWAATMGSSRVADLLLDRGVTGFTLITRAFGSCPTCAGSLNRAKISRPTEGGTPRRPQTTTGLLTQRTSSKTRFLTPSMLRLETATGML